MIDIDGSQGEGGGQILRTSLSLSAITGRPFRLRKIRAGRAKPGLQRQHLTAVRAAAEICGAESRGAALESSDLTFSPGTVQAGDFHFDIGTAGSTTLVLQTVLPPLLIQPTPSSVILEGGTHNVHAPPFDFLATAFLPLLHRMGASVSAQLERPGYYPAGGGELRVNIQPNAALQPLALTDRGRVRRVLIQAVVSRLPAGIAQREITTASSLLAEFQPDAEVIEENRARGPGNVVLVRIETEHVTELFTGFGARGVRAEQVAETAAREALDYLQWDVPVGPHLADQLLLPLAIGAGGSFLTGPITEHTRTNARVIQQFLNVEIQFETTERDNTLVRVVPAKVN